VDDVGPVENGISSPTPKAVHRDGIGEKSGIRPGRHYVFYKNVFKSIYCGKNPQHMIHR
jgi:hypothetical protein